MFFKRYFAIFKRFDWILFASVLLLVCFGLSAIYSLSTNADNQNFVNFKKQLAFAVIGLIILAVVGLIDYRFWRDLNPFFYSLAVILLTAVLFFGKNIRGTKGWFSVVGFNFQPVEIAKLALIIALAAFFSKRFTALKQFKNFFFSGLLTLVFLGLVALQPDFGSALILFLIWFFLVSLAGAKKKYIVGMIVLIAMGFTFAWFYGFADYQKNRILTFINPSADPYGHGYNVRQAIIAVGSGGWFGRGLGFGSQSQLKFIPESQTDFIFAVIAEELGFLGVSLVLLFWGIIFYRLIRAAASTNDEFASFMILGTSILLFSHLFINVGMNIGLMPVTGISLPFLSYGGSFLIITLVLIGITESIIAHSRN